MSELLRYRYFKYTRRGTTPEPVIGVFVVGIPEKVLKDLYKKSVPRILTMRFFKY
jgi:hypothetical protein